MHNEVVISFSFVLVFVTELRLVSKYLKMQESVRESEMFTFMPSEYFVSNCKSSSIYERKPYSNLNTANGINHKIYVL